MKLPPQLVMLTVVGVTGSVLFAAESNRPAREQAVAMAPQAEVDKEKKASEAAAAAGKPGEATKPQAGKSDKDASAAAKPDAAKTDAAKTAKDSTAAQSADTAADKVAAEKSGATVKSTPQRFVPSEEVRADFDVSFPVDI